MEECSVIIARTALMRACRKMEDGFGAVNRACQ
jgi:hypothetical protein